MIEIRITSHPRFLIIVRAVVGQLCRMASCPEAEQRKVVLAVDEACANIIKHTYHGDESQTIDILCKCHDGKMEIVLRDCGPPIDADCLQPRDLDDVRPGGLGLHFIRSIMDEVSYGYEKGCGNVLRMVKNLHGQETSKPCS
jgi:anti-sigma regulatory factor (Ser/Thr protein kinase)